MRTELRATILLLFLIQITSALSAEGEVSGNGTVYLKVPYYKRSFRVDTNAFYRAMGLDPKSFFELPWWFPGPYGNSEPPSNGVSAPEEPEEFNVRYSPVLKVNKEARQFFTAKGVDLTTSKAPPNLIFYLPQTATLYAEGSLKHVQFVAAILQSVRAVKQAP